MDQKTDIWEAFKAAAKAKAEFQTMLISKRGDRNVKFHEFHAAFAFIHDIVRHNSKFRDQKYGENKKSLTDAISTWFGEATDYTAAADGFALFDELV
jgi:hypothetical protein